MNSQIFPNKNKAAFSRIILLIKKGVFTCIMAVYDKKDCVNMCNQKNAGFTPELWWLMCLIFNRVVRSFKTDIQSILFYIQQFLCNWTNNLFNDRRWSKRSRGLLGNLFYRIPFWTRYLFLRWARHFKGILESPQRFILLLSISLHPWVLVAHFTLIF